jgi:hypothetical protein
MWQMMTRVYEQLARVINDRLVVGKGWNSPFRDPATQQVVANTANPLIKDNTGGALVLCTFAGANTALLIHHNLGYIPRCYVPVWKAQACDVYDAPITCATGMLANGPGLGLWLDDTKTDPVRGTNPRLSPDCENATPTSLYGATTQYIKLQCTVANATVLLLIF